jgi:hypothetical protein
MAMEAEDLNPRTAQHITNPAQFLVTAGVEEIGCIVVDTKCDPKILHSKAFSEAALFYERQLGSFLQFRKQPEGQQQQCPEQPWHHRR